MKMIAFTKWLANNPLERHSILKILQPLYGDVEPKRIVLPEFAMTSDGFHASRGDLQRFILMYAAEHDTEVPLKLPLVAGSDIYAALHDRGDRTLFVYRDPDLSLHKWLNYQPPFVRDALLTLASGTILGYHCEVDAQQDMVNNGVADIPLAEIFRFGDHVLMAAVSHNTLYHGWRYEPQGQEEPTRKWWKVI